MKKIHLIIIYIIALLSTSCGVTHENATKSNRLPNIYPDYTDVTIPVNIAPLNFLVRDKGVTAMEVIAACDGDESMSISATGTNSVEFDIDEWKELLDKAKNKKIMVQVYTRTDNRWTEHKSFAWTVTGDSIDPYLTYRLIEPDYEVWSKLQIKQRCVENFDEKTLTDHNLQENRCMNCHTFGNQNPQLSMVYVRGNGGGAILNRNGKLRKLNINADSLVSGSVYFGFSPSGRYITFSGNVIMPAFHAKPSKRLEVYDTKSGVYVADLDNNSIISSPLTNDSTWLETFPTFSPDGRYIYYCTANSSGLNGSSLDKLQYALVRIPFDEVHGTFGEKVDTLFAPSADGKGKRSVCHPKVSPDGRRILFTVADYGTFPIWHPEADLRMLDLQSGVVDSLNVVNSGKSDTYHSWSHNSRWFVFASKRDDGLYGKPYFCYVDRNGRPHKPFVLPQQKPTFYDNYLKSFNIPELGTGDVPFDAVDIERVMQQEAEQFKMLLKPICENGN